MDILNQAKAIQSNTLETIKEKERIIQEKRKKEKERIQKLENTFNTLFKNLGEYGNLPIRLSQSYKQSGGFKVYSNWYNVKPMVVYQFKDNLYRFYSKKPFYGAIGVFDTFNKFTIFFNEDETFTLENDLFERIKLINFEDISKDRVWTTDPAADLTKIKCFLTYEELMDYIKGFFVKNLDIEEYEKRLNATPKIEEKKEIKEERKKPDLTLIINNKDLNIEIKKDE